MRIVIDMQGAQTESRFRGIGRYSLSFTQAVVRNRGEHEVFLALNGLFPDTIEPIRAAFEGLLPQENIRVWYALGSVKEEQSGNETRRKVAELMREAFIASLQPDIVHITSLFEGYVDDAVISIGRFDKVTPVSVTLYDLIPLLNPEQYLKPNPRYEAFYRSKIESLNKSALLLAISNYAKQEALEPLAADENRIITVSTAIEDHFTQRNISATESKVICDKFTINQSFVLYTGGADERKNLQRLIQAYAALDKELRRQHQLVFAGKMPETEVARLKAIAARCGLQQHELIFTGYITDDELVILYNLCKLYIFPSWHEGFGLPALEAMACGAPVIGANATSLPEVIGLNVALFDPFDVVAISEKINHALIDDGFRQKLRDHAQPQIKMFSWNKTAKRSIKAFERIAKRETTDKNILNQKTLINELIERLSEVEGLSHLSEKEYVKLATFIDKNLPATERKPKIFLDISELAYRDARTGIQRVTRSILQALLCEPPAGYMVEPVYADQKNFGYRHARNFVANLGEGEKFVAQDDVIDPQPGDIFLGLDLQHNVVCAQKEYLSTIRRDGVKVYFVVYDLLPVLMPNFFPKSADVTHKAWLDVICEFDGVLCISQAVAKELQDWLVDNGKYRVRPFQISWFHLGADMENSVPTLGFPENAEHILNELKNRPTFLTVGTVEPRKGHQQILDAFELLWSEGIDCNLVVVGKSGWMVNSLLERLRVHSEQGKKLFWLEGISDEYLEKVYSASTCLIAASYGEGFGLPLIEAAQHKIPMIVRDIPVFREVAGEHAFYFKAQEPNELASAIQKWLDLYEHDQHPSSVNMPWFTWQQSAQQLLKIILAKG